jgi:hypothetical protein
MSIISSGTTTTTALVQTGNTDGTLQLQVNGTTPALTLSTAGAIGVGSTPGYGTAGQFLTSGGSGSAPTWTTQAASNVITATASGAIAAGDKVIVNSAGTVSAVAGQVDAIGIAYQYASSAGATDAVYDPVGGRVVVATSAGSNGYLTVGTVSGTVITWGTPVTFATNTNNNCSLALDATNGKVVITWKFSSGVAYAICGTLSGNSATFGTAVTLIAASNNDTSVAYDPVANRFVAALNNFTAPNYPIAFVLSVSGNVITVNSFVNITTAYNTFNNNNIYIVYDAASGKMVWTARTGTTGNPIAAVGTVSSTTTTWGTPVDLGINSQNFYLKYEPISQKTMLVWTNNSTSVPYSTVYSISGTTLTMNTATQISATTTAAGLRFCSDTLSNKIYFITANVSNYPIYYLGTISGTTATWGIATVLMSIVSGITNTVFNTAAGKIVSFFSQSSLAQSYAQALAYSNMTATNFIGFSGAAYSNGATATVQTNGSVNTNQSGLTAGLQYYVLGSGVLSTTAGTPSVYAGTAISATSIIVKG